MSKMESDGPYQFIGMIVEGPDGRCKITSEDKYIQAIKAQAHAEGRKSMEKDFQELLELANGLHEHCVDTVPWNAFNAWKQARGIE